MLEIPVLLIHGAADESVSVNNSRDLHDMCLHALLVVIQNAGHTFGLHHPWPSDAPLPHETVQLLENTVEFIQD
jgi:pimeloyl-ACP methyl ester carboxylesterase